MCKSANLTNLTQVAKLIYVYIFILYCIFCPIYYYFDLVLKVYNLLGHGLLCIVCLFTGTVVSANIYSVTHDPHLFGEDVEAFRPERFLSEDEVYTKPQKFIVFGMGKYPIVNTQCQSHVVTEVE